MFALLGFLFFAVMMISLGVVILIALASLAYIEAQSLFIRTPEGNLRLRAFSPQEIYVGVLCWLPVGYGCQYKEIHALFRQACRYLGERFR